MIDPPKYEICSEMLDIFIDISFLYSNDKHTEEADQTAVVKLALLDE